MGRDGNRPGRRYGGGMRVLVTGATGYIGGRLVPHLLEAGHLVRVLVRGRDSVRGRPWEKRVEVVRGDLLEPDTLKDVVGPNERGDTLDAAYYLVHSMYAGGDFEAKDREAAENFVAAVREHGGGSLRHVIYLGGVQPDGGEVKAHLRSRAEVGAVLAERLRLPSGGGREERGGRVTEFRAGPIIGSGSASFEMVRYLTERLPVMVTPRWVENEVRPIAVRDVLGYLMGALHTADDQQTESSSARSRSRSRTRSRSEGVTGGAAEPSVGAAVQGSNEGLELREAVEPSATRPFDDEYENEDENGKTQATGVSGAGGAAGAGAGLGIIDIGSDPLTFKQMMLTVAEARGLRRIIIPTPVLAPKLAARWVGAVTPIPNALAVPLVEGVVQPLVGDTTRARELFPDIEPIGFRAAVDHALNKIERGEVETRWSGAAPAEAGESAEVTTVKEDREGLARDQRTLGTDVPVEHVFAAVKAVGGEHGWYTYRWAWWLRGVFDAMIGGPGLRRSRRDPDELLEGEALDWWRVDRLHAFGEDPDHPGDEDAPALLRLRAEMKVPGKAWLQWEVGRDNGATTVKQTALFQPKGLPGTLYWYAMLPMHGFIFPSLLRSLEAEGRRRWRMTKSE